MTFGEGEGDQIEPVPAPNIVDPAYSQSGLVAYATLLALHQIAVDPTQLRHDLGHHFGVTSADLLRLAKREDGVRARKVIASWEGLTSLPLPALANGPRGWFLIGKATDEHVLIQRLGNPPEQVARSLIDALWSGELVLVTTREGIGGMPASSTSPGLSRRSSNIAVCKFGEVRILLM